jgi:hypothetical protein
MIVLVWIVFIGCIWFLLNSLSSLLTLEESNKYTELINSFISLCGIIFSGSYIWGWF